MQVSFFDRVELEVLIKLKYENLNYEIFFNYLKRFLNRRNFQIFFDLKLKYKNFPNLFKTLKILNYF